MNFEDYVQRGGYIKAIESLQQNLVNGVNFEELMFGLAFISFYLVSDRVKPISWLEDRVSIDYPYYVHYSNCYRSRQEEELLTLDQFRGLYRILSDPQNKGLNRYIEEELARKQQKRAITLKEGEWTRIQLKHPVDQYPSVKMALSFDTEALRIQATVNDLHFKDGNRSWRYGDGFFINIVMPSTKKVADSNRFYGLGFSLEDGKPIGVLVNRDGTFYLSLKPEITPNIEVDEKSRQAQYSIIIPWSFLQPFRPLLDGMVGINFVYTSQNDDGSRKCLRWIDDPHYDSEIIDWRRYAPLHFQPSDKSDLQLTGELENRLMSNPSMKVRFAIYSPESAEAQLAIRVLGPEKRKVNEQHKVVTLKRGLNKAQVSVHLNNPGDGIYTLETYLNDSLDWIETFYKFDPERLQTLKERIKHLAELASSPQEKSSVLALQYRLSELERSISDFEKRDDPTGIRDRFIELQSLLEECKRNRSIYQRSGYLLTAYLSPIDNTLQPFSFFLPAGFSPQKSYDLIVALHGSGVDEVSLVQTVSQRLAKKPSVIVGPRGRGLSDWYIGNSEEDVIDVIQTVKEMFQINQTILLGFSMGGYGAWRISFHHPECFDGIVIISGTPSLRPEFPQYDLHNQIGTPNNLPYLVFHGADDPAALVQLTDEFVKVLKQAGYNIEYIRMERGGHDINVTKTVTEWLKKTLQ